SSDLTDNAFINTYVIIPAAIPLPKLNVKIVSTIVINAGSDSVASLKSIFLTALNIITPTRISAGAVASVGMITISGVINNVNKNKIPVVTAVKPVRPPASTPAEDSTYVVITGKEKNDPIVVPPASTKNGLSISGKFPFLSNILPFSPTPSIVPKDEKKSGTKKASMKGKYSHFKAPIISSFIVIGLILSGIEKID